MDWKNKGNTEEYIKATTLCFLCMALLQQTPSRHLWLQWEVDHAHLEKHENYALVTRWALNSWKIWAREVEWE